MRHLSIFALQENIDGFHQMILMKGQKQSYLKRSMSEEHLVRKELLNFNFFIGNMDSQKYLEIFENSIDEINSLHPNGFILL